MKSWDDKAWWKGSGKLDTTDGEIFWLNGVPLLQNVCIASSYLEQDQFLWYKGFFSRKQLLTSSILIEEMIAHSEDTKSNTTTIKKSKRALLHSGK